MRTLSTPLANALAGPVQQPALLVELDFGKRIEYVGGGTGTNSATLPTHKTGDMVIVFAFRDGSTSAPTLPADYTQIQSYGLNSCSMICGYRVSDGTLANTSTWTNASSVVAMVYRGVGSIGAVRYAGGVGTTLTYPSTSAADMVGKDGTSFVVGFAGHRSANVTLTAPSGMTNRQSVADATDVAAGHDTGAGVSSWSAASTSVGGTSSGYQVVTVELVATETVRRWSSHGTISWDGKTWTAHPIRVAGLQVEALRVAGTLVIDNRDGDIGDRLTRLGIHDKPIRIWSYDADATGSGDVVWVANAVGGAATVTELEASISLRHAGQFVVSPRVTIAPQNGFNQVLPAGSLLRINGQDFKLERR